jgi:hypothetical protein
MDNTLALFITMVSVFVTYVSFIIYKYGILKSISQSYYELPEKYKPIFTLAMWGFAFPAMIIGTPLTGLMFFAAAGIMFVGAAAPFLEKITKPVHMIGAGSGVLFSQLAISLVFGMWYITLGFVIASSLLLLFRKQINYKHIWWIEVLAFTLICISLGIYIF